MEVPQAPLRVGRQAVPAPIQFGISPARVARQRNPKFEGIPLSRCDSAVSHRWHSTSPTRCRAQVILPALRKERALFKIAICARSRSVRAKSWF